MKKLLLGMFLATLSLVGCGTEEANLPETGQVMTTEDGRELVIEQRSAESGEEAPDVDAANVSVDEDSLACWVVLNYCRHPDTGRPHCTATGCTIAQAIKHCQALIRKHC
ncbi:hypothetical protein OWM54_10410 [Myxococcus sp. MISCRS1]|uniref:hypothetical protein n=1 Tax=Myxococcus sp. MISCRS1 TaxID=2996786 RepID=UPI00227203C9|nr:hypothetical protein [Myxococcus sp. MISCRS1]MCY0997548.1 hypothetical protein [Myxococcus sp. MISCRS1]